jgi:anti-sigma-K factor RskA
MILTKVSLCELNAEERRTFEQLAHSQTAQARLVERAQILLATVEKTWRPHQEKVPPGHLRRLTPGLQDAGMFADITAA